MNNGIIENFLELKTEQQAQGYSFTSDTDTEVIVHAIHKALEESDSIVTVVIFKDGLLTFKCTSLDLNSVSLMVGR